jgi:hypothetical protein
MNGLMNSQEQTQGFAERVSIAAISGQWFSPAPTGAVTAERRFWRTVNHG